MGKGGDRNDLLKILYHTIIIIKTCTTARPPYEDTMFTLNGTMYSTLDVRYLRCVALLV